MTEYKLHQTTHILNIHKHIDGGWFWNKYSATPYLGCEWGCEYCYCRDEKYNPHKNKGGDPNIQRFKDSFSQYIKVKKDAPRLLKKALKNRSVDLIYLFGYQPIETKYRDMRELLKVCSDLGFPVFINEKSPLLLEDLDILQKLNEKTYINIGWSIVFAGDDDKKRGFEPKAPSIESRFRAMNKLAGSDIMTGTVLMPVLPLVTDGEKYIEEIIRKTVEYGGKYVLEGGLTLWDYTKAYFYKALEKYKPDLIRDYNRLFDDKKAMGKYLMGLHQLLKQYCDKYDILNYIPRPLNHYPRDLRINKEIAGKFHLKAREIQLSKDPKYREWAYRKAAWSLDELNVNVADIYKQEGLDGITNIENIGQKIGTQIINWLKLRN